MEAGRIRLGARLVGLLDDAHVARDPLLERARRAARLLLVDDVGQDAELAFDAAWREARGRVFRRVRDRRSASARGRLATNPRLGIRTRRR